MAGSNPNIRKTFLTGALFAAPVAVTAFIIWWINDKSQTFTFWLFNHNIPFLGVAIALVIIYFIGMISNSLMGQYLMHSIDHALAKVPLIGQIYLAWKQIALTPGGTEGTFSKVALIPDETGQMRWLGFTSGRQTTGGEPMYCVFVPNAPNPITGRLYFVPVDKCTILTMSVEEAFKLILSMGNYVPRLVTEESRALSVEDQSVMTEE